MSCPTFWLTNGNPWEIKRPYINYRVGFYGSVKDHKWSPGEEVRRILVKNIPVARTILQCTLATFPSCVKSHFGQRSRAGRIFRVFQGLKIWQIVAKNKLLQG